MRPQRLGSIRGAGSILVLAAAVLWGTVGPVQVWADTGDDPVALGSARILIGGLALALLAVVSRARLRPLLTPKVWPWLLLAAVATGIYQAGFMFSVERTGAALATAVALGVAPAATGLFARLVDRDSLGLPWLLGTLAAVAGCVLLLAPGTSRVDAAGISFGIVSGICYGIYTVAAKRLTTHQVSMPAAVAVTLIVGGLIFSPVLVGNFGDLVDPGSVALLLWLGLIATAAAYMLFVVGLDRVSASTAGTLSLAEPLVAAVLGLLVLGEALTVVSGLGMALLLSGLVIVSVVRTKPAPAPDEPLRMPRSAPARPH
ncbi:DMT family transporter [Sinosporangium album]|uniref:DMT family transporter n=1 Tax=Sinosporangium album TaxID=504805 RepID=UPI000B829A9C|nr:EamA family transporter [Sinosporangium album]